MYRGRCVQNSVASLLPKSKPRQHSHHSLTAFSISQTAMLIATLALLPLLVASQCPTQPNDNSNSTNAELYHGQAEFSFDMLRAVAKKNPGDSIFFSPFSTYNALLLAYFGAANATEQSLKTALRIPEDQDKLATMQAYRMERFLQEFRENNGSVSYELSSANRVYLDEDASLKPSPCVAELLDGELLRLNFQEKPEESRLAINQWVEAETRKHITNLLPSGKITTQTRLVLVNAAYFKGLWQSRFQLENTRKEIFYMAGNRQTLVPMMKQKGSFNYVISERLGAHILQLPYKGGDVSLYIALPPYLAEGGVDSLISKLSAETLRELVDEDDASPRSVEISIPKFSIERTLELTPILEEMGLNDLFTSDGDLSGFSEGLHLDEATHKARLEVDEQGTRAAAATALFSFRISRPLVPTKFIANHPFVYFLYDNSSKSVLFTGVFRQPDTAASRPQ